MVKVMVNVNVQIGIDADETAEVHEEGEVEIRQGGRIVCQIEPLKGGFHILIQWGILLFFAQGGT